MGPIEEVVVVLHQRPPGLLGAADQLSSSARVVVAGFSTMTCAPASSASIASRRCEPGGVVTWTTSGRTSREHRPVVGVPAREPVPLGGALGRRGREIADRRDLDARQPSRQLRCCRAICPAPIRADLHRILPSCASRAGL